MRTAQSATLKEHQNDKSCKTFAVLQTGLKSNKTAHTRRPTRLIGLCRQAPADYPGNENESFQSCVRTLVKTLTRPSDQSNDRSMSSKTIMTDGVSASAQRREGLRSLKALDESNLAVPKDFDRLCCEIHASFDLARSGHGYIEEHARVFRWFKKGTCSKRPGVQPRVVCHCPTPKPSLEGTMRIVKVLHDVARKHRAAPQSFGALSLAKVHRSVHDITVFEIGDLSAFALHYLTDIQIRSPLAAHAVAIVFRTVPEHQDESASSRHIEIDLESVPSLPMRRSSTRPSHEAPLLVESTLTPHYR